MKHLLLSITKSLEDKEMKVLLVQPPLNPNIIGAGILYLNEPLALETVAASIPHHEVKILDMRIEQSLDQELTNFNPDVVGVTGYTQDAYKAIDILKRVKEFNKDILTIVGGHHASLLPEDFNRGFINVIVIGEGQDSFRELIDAYVKGDDFKRIDGLAFPDNEQLAFTRKRKPMENLDKTSIPDRSLTKKHRDKYFRASWRPVASIMTSRGCPYRCNFCSVWKREEGRYRTRSPERVVRELESITETYISVADDNFLQDPKRAEKTYELIKAKGIRKIYKLIGRSDTVVKHPELIEKWREIGMEMMFMGVESFRDDEIKRLNKTTTVNINNEAIRILQTSGVKVVGQFIIRPEYTKDDFEALAEYVKKMKLEHPIFSVLTPLPGTDLYEEKKDQLLTHNYEFFNLVHSVLPTRLPREEFYQHYADLFVKCYSGDGNQPQNILSRDVVKNIYNRLREAYKL